MSATAEQEQPQHLAQDEALAKEAGEKSTVASDGEAEKAVLPVDDAEPVVTLKTWIVCFVGHKPLKTSDDIVADLEIRSCPLAMA
jgi:hypothetical protein